MSTRRDAALVLTGIGLTDLMFRVAQVAVPLVVLAATGSAALTGLAAGATAVPVLLSPWWARRLRGRIRSGRAIALCYLGEAASLAAIPAAATAGLLSWPVLLLAGLALGVFETLDGPARDTLIADLGDRIAADRAFALLSTREFFRRAGMVAGPALGGAAVGWGHPLALLWAEAIAVLVSALLTALVGPAEDRRTTRTVPPATARIWPAVRGRRDVLLGWVVRGTGCTLWFAFSLGLALLGAETGRPGTLMATGLAAYGAGSLVGTPVSVLLLRRLPVLPAVCAAWALTGLAWALMGVTGSLLVIGAVAAVSGVAVAIGNGGVTALITRTSAGDERRALLAGQSVLVNGSSSAGLLVGGPVLALLGARQSLVGCGSLVALVALAVVMSRSLTARSSSSAPTVACACGESGNRARTDSPASVRESQSCRSSACVAAEM